MNRLSGAVQLGAGRVAWLATWSRRHWRWLTLSALTAWVVGSASSSSGWLLLGLAVAPGLVGCAWSGAAPVSYERLVAGPLRRLGWRWHLRRRWPAIARVCGLSERQVVRGRRTHSGGRLEETRWTAPRLGRVRARGNLIELTIRARPGQTIGELEAGAERLATTMAAVAHRVRPVPRSGCAVAVELVMLDVLTQPLGAVEPEPRAQAERVRLGRTQGGREWWLQLRGRHTLVAGCSGSGKGSLLWGICCGLAPAVRADVVRLWGVDLKRGVELAMGEPLFSIRAYTPAEAINVLRALMAVIDARGAAMAGTTRLHEPVVGDPLHLLVVDELAALTAYADLEVRREANRLLAEILTQGRALGVVVVACVQDPRKDVVGMRGLFTQTVALRLRSAEETLMVLGDGMSHLAPAHRISPTYPGTGWVVEDTGSVDRVRSDYWPDDLIRELARRYATPVQIDVRVDFPDAESAHDLRSGQWDMLEPGDTRKPRAPRKPRTPRTVRATEGDRQATVEDGAA